MFRRPSKVMEDALAGGGAGVRFLNLRGASTVEGGIPLTIDGKIIGGIGGKPGLHTIVLRNRHPQVGHRLRHLYDGSV